MNKTGEKLVIVLQESLIASVLKDIVTFAMFGGLLYFNHAVLDGNGWIDAIFIIFVMIWLSSLQISIVFKGKKSKAIKWLQEKE